MAFQLIHDMELLYACLGSGAGNPRYATNGSLVQKILHQVHQIEIEYIAKTMHLTKNYIINLPSTKMFS